MKNPLLQETILPHFNKIKAKHIKPALSQILTKNRADLKKLLKQHLFTWQNFIAPLENIEDRLHQLWSTVEHLNSVTNYPAFRKAYNACLPLLSDYDAEISHNIKLYQAINSIKTNHLNPAQKQVIKNKLRDFKLSGIHLNTKKKKAFARLNKKLSQLTNKFSENVLDATHAWTYQITDKKRLAGLPEHTMIAAQQAAKALHKKGYVFTLDFPVYYAVITYAQDREFRKMMYRAYVTRASEKGPTAHQYDNSKMMIQILKFRYQKIKLLGFKHFTNYSLATKMAKKPQEVFSFLNKLNQYSHAAAKREFLNLKKFSKQKMEAWDIAYYSDKLKKQLFDLSPEDLRPYFPEDQVLMGLFHLVEKLFSIKIIEKPAKNVWHTDVRFFEIHDTNKNLRGYFYTDLYARKGKRGGAWMADGRSRRSLMDGTIQIPITYLNCNFSKPVANKPALLTHDEVHTLFHEFGHCLQHLLTTVDYLDISGINGVPWDGVELASQFLENFCWEKKILNKMTHHYKTHKKLPDHLYKKLIKSKNFQSGMQTMRQLIFSLFDFQLHHDFKLNKKQFIQKTLNQIRKKMEVMHTPKYNRFQHAFTHIFSGGYAAGYYSYKWSEMLSVDAFDKFKRSGLFNKKIAGSFLKNILEVGGSRDFMQSFIKFRGRKPNIKALLHDSGINY